MERQMRQRVDGQKSDGAREGKWNGGKEKKGADLQTRLGSSVIHITDEFGQTVQRVS
jgi:hypothetical protein